MNGEQNHSEATATLSWETFRVVVAWVAILGGGGGAGWTTGQLSAQSASAATTAALREEVKSLKGQVSVLQHEVGGLDDIRRAIAINDKRSSINEAAQSACHGRQERMETRIERLEQRGGR